MYVIQRTAYGYLLVLDGDFSGENVQNWLKTCEEAVRSATEPFGILVDARTLPAFPENVVQALVDVQRLLLKAGLERSAVILRDHDTAELFRIAARKSGLLDKERIIRATHTFNWDRVALRWIEENVEP